MATRRTKFQANNHHLPLVRQVLELCEGRTEVTLCEKAGVAGGYISQLRSGAITNPSVFQLGCLAEALGHELVLKEKENGKDNNS